jgi:2-oxoglutarate dehydrogenase E1 component
MLPHGLEGQGPEHSSARLERFLLLCAQENIQVCNPSTPAQMFHLLRRELIRPYRKPLAIMTPKSTLRRKISFSTLEDLSERGFQLVIDEVDDLDPDEVTRIVICSGKVYYDLLEERRKQEQRDVALLRIEQLYPFPDDALRGVLERYRKARTLVWTQEEPRNQGAWFPIQHNLRKCMRHDQALEYAGRPASASPAVGDAQKHIEQQRRLVARALGLERSSPVAAPTPEPRPASVAAK